MEGGPHATSRSGRPCTLTPSFQPQAARPHLFNNAHDISSYHEMATLHERLQGTWRLESYVSHPAPNSTIQRLTYPMTKSVAGLLIYSSDGYMSAQLQIPGSQKEKANSFVSESQWAELAKRSFSYSGPFYISNEGPGREEVLRHSFELCILPDRVGQVEIRSWKFDEDGKVLVLGGEETVVMKGDERIPVLRWRRVEDNKGAALPEKVPDITFG